MKSLINLVGIQHKTGATNALHRLPDGTPLLLIREPSNPHDPNAIMVLMPLGYVKATQAKDLSSKINDVMDCKLARNDGHYVELEIDEPDEDPTNAGQVQEDDNATE